MKRSLKILILEDSTTDAEILKRFLKKEMLCDIHVAMSRKSFLEELESFLPDIILSDHSLPQFNSDAALKLTRERFPHLPFILVTGTVSEEYAANIIKEGADDYILKDRIARLPAAIDAALAQRRVQKEIADYKYALDQAADMTITDQKGIIIYANENFCKISGYPPDELLGQDHRLVNSAYHPASFIKNLWVTIANGDIWHGEFRNKAKDGTFYWEDTTVVPFLDNRGKPYQYLAIRKDITQRKLIEGQLQKSEEKYRTIFLKSPLPIWIFDTETLYFLDVNEAAINHYGYTQEEFLSMRILDIRPPEDIVLLMEDLEQIRSNKETRHGYWRHLTKNGKIIHVETTAHPIEYNDRKARMVIANDVTDKIKAEEEVRQSERRLNEAQSIAHISNWQIDLAQNLHTWSDEMYRIYGVDKTETTPSAELFLSFMHPDDAEAAQKMILDAFITFEDSSFYFRFIRKDGEVRHGYTEWKFELDKKGDPVRLFGILQDITERKEAEEKLQAAHNRLLFHIENAPLGFIEWDSEIKPKSWSKRAEQIFGWSENEAISDQLDWFGKVHEDDLPWVSKIAKDLISGKIERKSVQHRNYTQDGRVIWCEWFNSVLKDEHGNVITILSLVADITEKIKAEEELKKINERFQYATKASSDIIWELNFETKQYFLYEGKEKLFGTDKGIDWKTGAEGTYIVEEDRERVQQDFAAARRDPNRVLWDLEYKLYSATNTELDVINHGIFIRDEKGKATRAIGAITDITEKKKLEKELLEQQRQGQLKIIATALEAQEKERIAIGQELHDNVNQILVAANMMLTMTKTQPEKAQEMIETTKGYLQQAIAENRKIAHVFVAPDLETESLSDQLQRLVHNMLGTAGLETQVITDQFREERLDSARKINIYRIAQEQCTNIIKYAKATSIRIELTTTEDDFKMTIADNGVGMDETKKSTGIGLRNINGRLSLFSGSSRIITAPGKGFELEICIPLEK